MLGKLIKWLIVVPILGLLLYLGYPYLLRGIGRYLVTEDPLKHADAVVVLAGDGGVARTLEAVRLYQDGYAPRIILTHQILPRGYEALARFGISVPEERDIQWMVLKGMRIPRAAVLQISERANSTDAEMRALVRFMDQQRVGSVILVTSKSHSTRARKILSRTSGGRITIISRPTRYDAFDPDAWWRSRRDAKEVFQEYPKLVNYWMQGVVSVLTGWMKGRERDPAKVVASHNHSECRGHCEGAKRPKQSDRQCRCEAPPKQSPHAEARSPRTLRLLAMTGEGSVAGDNDRTGVLTVLVRPLKTRSQWCS
jgi:uncharacterized SAM-binding protein YcdF (DUF218 family)